MKWREEISTSPALTALEEKVRTGGVASVRGATGSSTSIITQALAAKVNRVTLLATAHVDEADEVIAEWQDLGLHAAAESCRRIGRWQGGVDRGAHRRADAAHTKRREAEIVVPHIARW
jgi:hypothetical protein